MTLIASPPNIQHNLDPKSALEYISEEDNRVFRHDEPNQIKKYNPTGELVQNLGYMGPVSQPIAPYIENVSIENSTDVHIGDKNIYKGPVTIKQVVYANNVPGLLDVDSPTVSDAGSCETEVDSGYITDGGHLGEKYSGGDRKVSFGKSDPENGDVSGKGFRLCQSISQRKPWEILVLVAVMALLLVGLTTILVLRTSSDITAESEKNNAKVRITSRQEWVAQPPTRAINKLAKPVPNIVMYQTKTENCSSHAQCVFRVRFLQTFDIESKGLSDIAYNFLVGGDGAIYEGRGWNYEGGHSVEYNSKSFGIAFIGTFTNTKPTEIQTVICKKLIKMALEDKHLKENYKLLIDKKLTEESGTELYEELKTWSHFSGVA